MLVLLSLVALVLVNFFVYWKSQKPIQGLPRENNGRFKTFQKTEYVFRSVGELKRDFSNTDGMIYRRGN